jgi:dTDP-4-dehydrorhamnose 3,5-epimerase
VQVIETTVDGVLIVEPTVFSDDRGFFFESFNKERFEESTGVVRDWVQDNHSRSARGVLRGLHFQKPNPQGKLIRCTVGTIWDVAVDLRASSATFGTWAGVELSSESHRQLWIPEGLAHGFLTLSDFAEVLYKATAYYDPSCDRSLRWDDPDLGIEWPTDEGPLLSIKDQEAPLLGEIDLFT